MSRLAAGSGASHAHEQPRSRGGGATRRSRRVRWDRPRGAIMGGVRRHRRDAANARVRRNIARPEWQTRGCVSHACCGASRTDCEQQPRGPLGNVGKFSRARAGRPHDVWSDDGRFVDLHRDAGDSAGNVRNVRRGRATTLRRFARWPVRAHRGPRRHGWRAAPRSYPERGRVARHRGRRVENRQTSGHRIHRS